MSSGRWRRSRLRNIELGRRGALWAVVILALLGLGWTLLQDGETRAAVRGLTLSLIHI